MSEPQIGVLVTPRQQSRSTYDITYTHTIPANPDVIDAAGSRDFGTIDICGQDYVLAIGSWNFMQPNTIYNLDMSVEVVTADSQITMNDPTSPHSDWTVWAYSPSAQTSVRILYLAYGVLPPSSYPASTYELVGVNKFKITIDSTYAQLLYGTNPITGKYEPKYNAVVGNYGTGNRAAIEYEVVLRNLNTLEEITVSGTNNDYSVGKSPYGTNLVFARPVGSFGANGDMDGTVTMTETPAN